MDAGEWIRAAGLAALVGSAAVTVHYILWLDGAPFSREALLVLATASLCAAGVLAYRGWRARQPESPLDEILPTHGLVQFAAALALFGEAVPVVLMLGGLDLGIHVHAVFVAIGALGSVPAVLLLEGAKKVHPWEAILDQAQAKAQDQLIHTVDPRPTMARPVFLRELATPGVTYSDVVGLDEAKLDMREAIRLMENPDLAKRHGLEPVRGLLLDGPPGTGKTLFARATAGEFGKRFLEVRCSDLVSQYVGETEKNIAAAFAYARSVAPAILFIDEVDGLARSRRLARNDWEISRVNALLTEMDGIAKDDRTPIVLAATNRLEDLDEALLRPGRFDRKVHLGLPGPRHRALLLQQLLQGTPVEAGLPRDWLVQATDGMSPADLRGLVQDVKRAIFREGHSTPRAVRQEDLERALRAIGRQALASTRLANT